MGEIRLDHCCRLCLKEGFSLTNVFSHRSAAGDPLYRILNFIYDIEISEYDGLPSQICSPCMWRMIEFDACKRNVRSAEAEIMRLLNQTRPNPGEVSKDGLVNKDVQTEMLSIKDEIDIEEWEIPKEIPGSGNIISSSQLSEVPNSLSLEDCDDTVNICLGESSSITTTPENNMRIRDINKGTFEKDLKVDVEQIQESLSAEQPNSFINVTEPGPSHLQVPLSKIKNIFICDICRISFQYKYRLGNHIRVHYHVRQFSCSVCNKCFKQDNVRYRHELSHLRDKKSVGKSENGSKSKQFTCGVCGKHFGSKSGLSAHLIQHGNQYSCSSCGKSFGSNTNLKNHSRVHTMEKPFKCEKCWKSFNLKGNLTRHMTCHSSDKPFSCRFCEKKFKTKCVKNKHELQHFRKI